MHPSLLERTTTGFPDKEGAKILSQEQKKLLQSTNANRCFISTSLGE
jgi:hypothetical protein